MASQATSDGAARLFHQIKRLARHSLIYGLGGLISRIIAVLLLPIYTRYLTPADYGAVETLVALVAVLVTVLRAGMPSAFFRFWFDSRDQARRLLILRTAFWFTMASATFGMLAGFAAARPLADLLFGGERIWLVVAAFVLLWSQVNYEQIVAVFRLEERSLAFVAASLVNLGITIVTTVLLVVVLGLGATGVVIGNFTGTLCVYLGLLAHRREQLGLQFSRSLLREMNRFGLPLVPSALALWTLNFSDRFFLNQLSGTGDVGVYSIGVRISSALVLLIFAFRTAWAPFAYSIEDDREARRTYSFVLTYLLLAACWLSLALALLAPWLVRLLTTPEFYGGSRVVGPLSFALAAYAGYIVIGIGIGRTRQTRLNWTVTGAAAVVNVALNLILIPPYGIMGAAIATVGAYVAMFAGMALRAHRVYPVPYQWRRVATLSLVAVGLVVLGKAIDVPLGGAIALAAVYPLVLLPLGFYLPGERRRILAPLAYRRRAA